MAPNKILINFIMIIVQSDCCGSSELEQEHTANNKQPSGKHTHACTHTHTHMHICTHSHTCKHPHIHTRAHTYSAMCTHAHTHTHTHTHTNETKKETIAQNIISSQNRLLSTFSPCSHLTSTVVSNTALQNCTKVRMV